MKSIIYKRQDNPVFCDVLVRPLATEKTVSAQAHGSYAFLVASWANKPLVRRAVESLFDVKVDAVQVLNQRGKSKSFKGRLGVRQGMRKAYVKLKAGHHIELAAGM